MAQPRQLYVWYPPGGQTQYQPPANLGWVIDATPGRLFSLAIKLDGALVGWGSNTFGQLGYLCYTRQVV
ncbi:MAG: hypothetical protein ACKVW3_02545 [Phycisphaerales bacterium]